jgi:hypothetical protein
MTIFKNQNYHHKVEHSEYQAKYHKDDICGSSFHGLAQTIQKKLRKDEFTNALNQIQKCIDMRYQYLKKNEEYENHLYPIRVLQTFYKKVFYINENHYLYKQSLPELLIHYKRNQFIFYTGVEKKQIQFPNFKEDENDLINEFTNTKMIGGISPKYRYSKYRKTWKKKNMKIKTSKRKYKSNKYIV